MVAYNFKSGFIQPIRLREKQQTIRNPRKRHAQVGETLQLQTGSRYKPVRLGLAVCDQVAAVRLDFVNGRVEFDDSIVIEGTDALNEFAIRDGFNPPYPLKADMAWEVMRRWWAVTHPGHDVFLGVLIGWGESFQAVTR